MPKTGTLLAYHSLCRYKRLMGHTTLSDAAAVARLHATIRAELDTRESNAKAAITQAEAELEQIAVERGTLVYTEQMYGRYWPWPAEEENPSGATEQEPPSFSFENSTEPVQGKSRLPRARFGPKRYRMLIAVRDLSELSAEGVAAKTNLALRRVKDQLGTDTASGILNLLGDTYQITPLGRDLLTRFEVEQRRSGKRLPSFDDSSADEDHEDGAPEEHMEEEASAV